ncbi:LysM peptidoglycan-binding domain-containing M23 family metallopeptidase, partial [Streptomyces sp. NPDC042898]|uniref:M23 family metallopeptidase n=1 Tax=Streptomyces sp. NPDC042898 TaxID=3154334 RepID=UPI0033DF6296
VPAQAVAAQVKAPAALQAAPTAAAKAAPKTYSVVSGDYLSKIATEHHLAGGWQKLYADNRQVVGENPSLILPGMKLTLGAKSTATAAAPKSAAPKAAAHQRTAPKAAAPESTQSSGKNGDTQRASRSSERSSAPAAATSETSASQPSQASQSSGSSASASGWVTPVAGGGFSTPYRASGSMWSSGYHTGVDFIASSGTTVRAVGAGTVVSAGWSGAYGNEVVIQHADGNYSQYAHLSSLSVSSGQTVSGGQQLGLSGSTGNSTGPHLHFEIRTSPSYGSDVDPLAYLRQHGVSV